MQPGAIKQNSQFSPAQFLPCALMMIVFNNIFSNNISSPCLFPDVPALRPLKWPSLTLVDSEPHVEWLSSVCLKAPLACFRITHGCQSSLAMLLAHKKVIGKQVFNNSFLAVHCLTLFIKAEAQSRV